METFLNYYAYSTALRPAGAQSAGQRHDYQRAEWGLHRYALQVAGGLELGPEAVYCEVDSGANVYIALDQRLPGLPGYDAALLWNSRCGWALGIEYSDSSEVLMLSYLGTVLLPDPSAVVLFAKSALAGQPAGQLLPPQPHCPDLTGRLAEYSEP